VLELLKRMADELRLELSGFEPELVTSSEAVRVFEAAAGLERLAGSLKLLAAKRACESGTWRQEGHRSAASWVAQKEESSYSEALSVIETAEALESLPATAKALRDGGLSASQVKEVTAVASSHPEAEDELLRMAAQGSLKKLKEHARQVRARAASKEDELARYRAIHQRRYLRHWNDPEGDFHLDARLTPDAGARLLASIQAESDRIFDEARSSGSHEPAHAYGADALVALVTGQRHPSKKSPTERPRTDTVVVRVDAAALRRGYAKGAETCEIRGVGPVPVATASAILKDAFVKILVTDGVDVTTVCHVGRSVPAHVQSALEERDRECVVGGCGVVNGLENHHWKQDYAECKTTSLEALARVCRRHHHAITYEGFELVGGPGRWRLLAPAPKSGSDTS
jgi:Domain of unknown function (DUF222)